MIDGANEVVCSVLVRWKAKTCSMSQCREYVANADIECECCILQDAGIEVEVHSFDLNYHAYAKRCMFNIMIFGVPVLPKIQMT